MKVNVLLFAGLREVVGASERPIEVEGGASLADVWAALSRLHPRLEPHTGTIAFALNGSYAKPDERVSEGDEVAFLPPVSGG